MKRSVALASEKPSTKRIRVGPAIKHESRESDDRDDDQDKDNLRAPSLASVRDENKLVMLHLYGWLTPFDRLALRRVSKAFYQDENLCQKPQGVYGPDNVDIFQALQQVKDYFDFCGTPDSLRVEGNLPKIWDYSNLIDEDDEENYDLYQDISGRYDAANGGSYRLGGLDRTMHRRLSRVNYRRQQTRVKLNGMRQSVLAYQSNGGAPYNLLFALLLEHRLTRTPFWKAERPWCEQESNGYQIIRNGGALKYISHLRPAGKILFANENGGVESRSVGRGTCGAVGGADSGTVGGTHCGAVGGAIGRGTCGAHCGSVGRRACGAHCGSVGRRDGGTHGGGRCRIHGRRGSGTCCDPRHSGSGARSDINVVTCLTGYQGDRENHISTRKPSRGNIIALKVPTNASRTQLKTYGNLPE
jgi:hypothetical protein